MNASFSLPELSAPEVPAGAAAVRGALHALNRNKLLFATTALVIAGLASAITLALPKSYTATALVGVAPTPADPLSPSSANQPRLEDSAVDTQAEVLKSPQIVRQVVDQLGIGAQPSPRSPLMDALCRATSWASLCAPPKAPTLDGRTGAFIHDLKVQQVGKSNVIQIDYSSSDPTLAAEGVNRLVKLVQQQQVQEQANNLQRTTAWLDQRAKELSQRVNEAEDKAARFRAQSGLNERVIGNNVVPLVANQIGDAATGLSAAQAQLAEAQARASALAAAGGGVEQALHLSDEPLVVAAATNLSDLQARRAALSQNYGDRYPAVSALDGQIAAARRAFNTAVGRAQQAINQDLAVKRAAVERLQHNLTDLRGQGNAAAAPAAQLRQLDREAETATSIYSTFFERAREVADRTAILEPSIRVISAASTPEGPSFPQTTKMLLASLVLGLVGGGGVAFGREYLRFGSTVGDRTGRSLAVPLLAHVPMVPMLKRMSQGGLPRYVAEHPFSPAAEAVRSLASHLALSRGRDPERLGSVVISSATGSEGKTTIALWLAEAVARTGMRALVIDGDHRKGAMQRTLSRPSRAGFTEWVTGAVPFEDVVQSDVMPRLDFIAAGAPMARLFSGAELKRLQSMLIRMKQVYGIIVIDTPPMMAMAEPLLYASVVDHTVLVARHERTSQVAVQTCVERLRAVKANVSGIVLSMVDPSSSARYGEGATLRDVKLLSKYYAG